MSLVSDLARSLIAGLPDCPSTYTPYGAYGATFLPSKTLGRLEHSKQHTHISCLTRLPATSHFALAHAVRREDIPESKHMTDHDLPMKFVTDSFHAIMACYAAGGGLKYMPWVWREWGRLLKPGGLIFLEAAPSRRST